MTIWGNLTFYIGRVSRQACIEKLAQELGAKLEQEERNSEYIPILSFQCTTNGAYVEHSLSLSTVIWAISQVEGKQNGKLSDLLSSRAYSDTIEQLEREFFESDNFNEQEAIEEASVKVNSEGMPVFADDAIVASKIMSIHSEIVKMYGKFFPENVIEERNGFKYQLFKNSKAKDKYDDDNYMGLSHDFFSNDLKMVKESIEAGKDDFSTGMLSNLIDYICAPHDVLEERQRHDFVRPKDKEVFYKESAVMYSIVETAKANNLNIFQYLYMVLLYMTDYMNSSAGIEQLMPWSDFIKEQCSGIIDVESTVPENRIPLPCR